MTNRWKRTLLILSLSGNVLFAALTFFVIDRKGGLPWLEGKVVELFVFAGKASTIGGGYAAGRMSVFEQLPSGPKDIVFLGDSIFDFGEWHELMADPRAKNRSINGDDTHSVLKRLHQITVMQPAHVVILVGINDFQKQRELENTKIQYEKLIERLLSETSDTQIWLLPVFPVNPGLYRRWILPDHPGIHMPEVSEVQNLNRFIEELAARQQMRVHFISVQSILNPSGYLDENYTLDGLHLNGRGLSEIAKALKSAMDKSP